MKEITLSQNTFIDEKEYPELRDILGRIVTDYEYDLSDSISWFNEDNTGEIQIACDTSTQGSLELLIDTETEQLDTEEEIYSEEELDVLNKLLTFMIEFEKTGSTFISYK